MRKIGIFGGNFDPIHFGHLRPALEILNALRLDEIRFIPVGRPPLRPPPCAPAKLRLQMVEAAIAGQPRFIADARELERQSPSYTVDTLAGLHKEWPSAVLLLLVGMDAFLSFPDWHEWHKIFEYAHVIVAHRPAWRLPDTGALADTLHERRVTTPQELWSDAAGHIFLQPVTQLDIASTTLRASIAAGGDPLYLVPETVRELIVTSGCYLKTTEH